MSSHPPIDQELASLRGLIVEMANRVDEQFADAMNALLQGDEALAETVVERDDEVDELEMRIDQQCERILALHAPVAADLRMLIMAVKINTDFERIGDHCRNLSRNTPHLANAPDLLAETNIPQMADMARCMLREVEMAFLEHDRLKARKVIARDLQVNRLHAETFEMLVERGREAEDERAEVIAHLLTASKALERISDHAKNIAQSIVFMIEGTDIRHRGLQAPREPKDSTASLSDAPADSSPSREEQT
jgi:phosphate transport system protein